MLLTHVLLIVLRLTSINAGIDVYYDYKCDIAGTVTNSLYSTVIQ